MSVYGAYSDQELIALLKQGDRAAFNELYDRYAQKAYVQVNQMLRDEEAAKDIVQDLFITIWNKADNIKPGANVAGYLYIAAQNITLKHIRHGRLKNDYLNSLSELQEEWEGAQGEMQELERLYGLIEQEVSKLPGKMKTIFELSRRGDLSYKDIAAELGIAENTVRKQVSNALKVIRSNVEKHGASGLIVFALMRN